MRVEVNPKSLLHLEGICEVLYKLHPYVLEYLISMNRRLGPILGNINITNSNIIQREMLQFILSKSETMKSKPEESEESEKPEKPEGPRTDDAKDWEEHYFSKLRRHLQLDSYEYIPIQIYIEVEDPVIGRKVKELVEALNHTEDIEQFYLNKREIDEDAYFAEGYGLKLNEEQKKQRDVFLRVVI